MKYYSLLIVLLLGSVVCRAQELNCKVTVLAEKITNVDKEVFKTMERSISDFMNTRKWTDDQFQINEKIECNILINLTGLIGSEENAYTATINISATRPVYNATYTTPTVNYMDRDLAFRYSQYNPLTFNDNRVAGSNALEANLTAVLAYYAYLVIGLDYDSFSANAGTPYFKKAQNIVNNAPEQGSVITGWKAFDSKTNRYWLVDQILNPRFRAFHSFWYMMHRDGMDNMYKSPSESGKTILSGVSILQQLKKENPGAVLLQFLFNAKSTEFLNLVGQLSVEERAPFITLLAQTDVTNANKYEDLKK